MKKLFIRSLLPVLLCTSFQANALIGVAVSSPITMTVGAIPTTLSGLYLLQCTLRISQCYMEYIGMELLGALGIVILDGENGQQVQFENVPTDDLLEMGLTEDEATAYNRNIDELNLAYSIVSSELTAASTKQDVDALWKKQGEIIGTDALTGLSKIIEFNVQHAK